MAEPELLGDIARTVMQNIERRCEQYRKENGLPTIAQEREAKVKKEQYELVTG